MPEESIHYKRKTGRAFAGAIFRTVEWKNERASTARENTGFARGRESDPRLLYHHRRHARIFILHGKKWAGVCNVILHKQDQLIFMRTNERVSETAPYQE